MGCLKIGGRVVGGTDGPSRSYPACFESAKRRQNLGCDGMPLNGVEKMKRQLSLDNSGEQFRSYLATLGLNGSDIAQAMELAGFGRPAAYDAESGEALPPMHHLGRVDLDQLRAILRETDGLNEAAIDKILGSISQAQDDESGTATPTTVDVFGAYGGGSSGSANPSGNAETSGSTGPGNSVSAMGRDSALDRMFPHRNRLHGNNGRLDAKAQAAFDERFGAGHIRHDPYPAQLHGHGNNAHTRAEMDAWTKRMFPDAGRLK